LKGKKNFVSAAMPHPITNISKLEQKRGSHVQGVLVGLQNGEVRLYNDRYLVNTIRGDVRVWMKGVGASDWNGVRDVRERGRLSDPELQKRRALSQDPPAPGQPLHCLETSHPSNARHSPQHSKEDEVVR